MHSFAVRLVPGKLVWGLGDEEGAAQRRGAETPALMHWGGGGGQREAGRCALRAVLTLTHFSLRKQWVPAEPLKIQPTYAGWLAVARALGPKSQPAVVTHSSSWEEAPRQALLAPQHSEKGCGSGQQRSWFRKSTPGPALPCGKEPRGQTDFCCSLKTLSVSPGWCKGTGRSRASPSPPPGDRHLEEQVTHEGRLHSKRE